MNLKRASLSSSWSVRAGALTALGLLAACASNTTVTESVGDDRPTESSPAPLDPSAAHAERPAAARLEAGALTVTDVENAIATRRARWTAGPTSVSALPLAARRAMQGVAREAMHPDERLRVLEEHPSPVVATKALPSSFDWRDKAGKNYVSPILDQGRCGSCVAFAIVGTFETQLNIGSDATSSPWQLSPQQLFSCGGGACSYGWNVGPAVQYAVYNGVTDNACMPYASGAHGDDVSCSKACSDKSSRLKRGQSYTTPTYGALSVNAVKNALLKGPLVTTMDVYDDFAFYTGGVYEHVTGDYGGGHAISIVGWNDDRQSWIVRNSWSTSWGMDGFFEIAWGDYDSGLGNETWGIVTRAPGPYVALAELRDHAVLSGVVPLAFEGSGSVASQPITWTLTKGTQQVTSGAATLAASGALDTTGIADGTYSLQAQAGSVRSDPKVVYVLNGAATGSIAFSGLSSGQTVSDVVMFDVNITSAPVPVTRVEWTVKDANGQVVVSRATANTGPLMELGWRTTNVPNGTYTLTVTGSVGGSTIASPAITVKVKN